MTVMATNITFNDEEILGISKSQKVIILLILLVFPAYFAAIFFPVLGLIFGIITLVFIHRLAAALKAQLPWLYVLLAIVPCINFIALLVLNSRANSALKARGIRVGLMGANGEDLKTLVQTSADGGAEWRVFKP